MSLGETGDSDNFTGTASFSGPSGSFLIALSLEEADLARKRENGDPFDPEGLLCELELGPVLNFNVAFPLFSQVDVPGGAPSMGALTWALSLNNAGGSAIVTVVSSLFVPVNSAVSTIWSKSSSSNTWGVYSGGKLTGSRLNLGLSLSPNGKINSAVSVVEFDEDRVLRTGIPGEESETKSEIVLCIQQQEIEVSAKSLKPEVDKFKIVDKKCKSVQLAFKIRDVSKTKKKQIDSVKNNKIQAYLVLNQNLRPEFLKKILLGNEQEPVVYVVWQKNLNHP